MPSLAPEIDQTVGLPRRIEQVDIPRADLPQPRRQRERRHDVEAARESLPDNDGHAALRPELDEERVHVPVKHAGENADAGLGYEFVKQPRLRLRRGHRERVRPRAPQEREQRVEHDVVHQCVSRVSCNSPRARLGAVQVRVDVRVVLVRTAVRDAIQFRRAISAPIHHRTTVLGVHMAIPMRMVVFLPVPQMPLDLDIANCRIRRASSHIEPHAPHRDEPRVEPDIHGRDAPPPPVPHVRVVDIVFKQRKLDALEREVDQDDRERVVERVQLGVWVPVSVSVLCCFAVDRRVAGAQPRNVDHDRR